MAKQMSSRQRAATGMSIGEHLAEARRRFIISALAVTVLAVGAFLVYNPILHFLQQPYCRLQPGHCTFLVTAPLDGLTLRVKIAFFGGAIAASPIIFFQAWRFITPGLKDRERKYAVPFVFASLLFFLGGCAMAYFSFEHALQFLISVGGSSLEVRYNPNQYLSLIIMMMFFFGLAFEFPVVLVSMELAGAVRPVTLLKGWRWAIIAIASVSAIFTPSGDPLSMMLLMIPLIVFYFASIAVGKLAGK